MRKKITAILLLLIFAATSLIGCSNSSKPDNSNIRKQAKNTSVKTGRFMESEVALPELKDGETIVKILSAANNQIELYTHLKTKYIGYRLQKDMTWQSSQPGWLNNGKLSGNQIEFRDMCFGVDGNYYATYTDYDISTCSRIIKSDDGGKTAHEIKIPYLEEGTNKNGSTLYPTIAKMDVLENGNLVLYDMLQGNSMLIFSQNGEKLDKVSIADSDNTAFFKAFGNNIITVSQDRKSIIFYNSISKKAERTIEYNSPEGASAFAQKPDGTVLMGNKDGIHRLSKDSTLWETTVDGALNSMSMPSLFINELFATGEDEEQYYASYTVTDGNYKLMHYVYDKNVSAVPSHEITVYSLMENATIRQAISLFQSKDADIKVNYVVAMGKEGGKVSDYIRALNTELLAGNGADVLVLDGLPVDSYIDKGVLADISGIIKPLVNSNTILSNIADCYVQDGKAYRTPVRFTAPAVLGNKDAISSVKDMDSIMSFMKSNTKLPYSHSDTYRKLLQNYLALYSKDFYSNGKLDREKLSAFLKNLKEIADNIKATESDKDDKNTSDYPGTFISSDILFNGNILGLANNKFYTGMLQIGSFSRTVIPIEIAKSKRLEFSTVNQTFIPKGLIGMNRSSKESDIAKKFINFLFTGDVQNSDVYDGFPVNRNSLEKWADEENSYSVFLGDHEGNRVSANWPGKKERTDFLNMLLGLKIPIDINQTINDIIIDETLPFFTGKIDAEQASSAAESKISTYLSE